MAAKKAFIVDDSKLALFVLKKMLVEIGLEVDTAQSAEEALGYLAHKRPDVIFLDHTMPGIDGLQALKIIKDNPDIAMIPVMMYTSKEDQAYIEKAKALGAIDILPKQLKPSTLRSVLNDVDLLPELNIKEVAADKTHTVLSELESTSSDVQDLSEKEELSGLLRDAESALEKESLKQFIDQELERYFLKYRNLVRQAAKRFDATLTDISENHGSPLNFKNVIVLAVLFLVTGFFVYAYIDLNSDLDKLESKIVTLADAQGVVINVDSPSLPVSSGRAPDLDGLVDALAQAANQNSEVAFGESLVDESVAQQILEWMLPLNAANYSGELQVSFSAGRFCLVANSEGQFILPDPKSAFSDCQVMDFDFDQESAQLVLLQRLAKDINNDDDNAFAVSIVTSDIDEEVFRYPAENSTLTAGDWNRVAQKNHRVDYFFR